MRNTNFRKTLVFMCFSSCLSIPALAVNVTISTEMESLTSTYSFEPGRVFASFDLPITNPGIGSFVSSETSITATILSVGGTAASYNYLIEDPAGSGFNNGPSIIPSLYTGTYIGSPGLSAMGSGVFEELPAKILYYSAPSSLQIKVLETPTASTDPQTPPPLFPFPMGGDSIFGSLKALAKVAVSYSATYNVDDYSFFDKAADWLGNVSAPTVKGLLAKFKKAIREQDSVHAAPATKSLYLKQGPASSGLRGSVDFQGFVVHTASPGILAYDLTLPDDASFDVPLAFTKNKGGAVLDIAFDGHILRTINGDDYGLDEVNMFDLDISQYSGQQGQLTFTLNTSGLDSAEFFVPEDVAFAGFNFRDMTPIPELDAGATVAEPQTFALLLAGLGLMGFLEKRRKVKQY